MPPRKPKLPAEIAAFFAHTGAKGGAAGTGKAKSRGDAEYYRKLVGKRHRKVKLR